MYFGEDCLSDFLACSDCSLLTKYILDIILWAFKENGASDNQFSCLFLETTSLLASKCKTSWSILGLGKAAASCYTSDLV